MMMKFCIEVALYRIYEVLAQHWYEGEEAIFGLMLRRNTFNWHLDCCYKPSAVWVINCDGYYVDYINGIPKCHLRHCDTN